MAPTPTSPKPTPPRIAGSTDARAADFRRRLWVAGPSTAVVVTVSMLPAAQFTGWQWVVAVLSLPVVTWAAWPFHSAAWRAGRHGSTTMDTLVSLGVIATTLWSWWALLFGGAAEHDMQMTLIPSAIGAAGHHGDIYFEGAATIVTFLLIGRLMEARARHSAGDALRSLLEMGAKTATLVRIDSDTGVRQESTVPASDLAVGDLFLVRPGEKVATDGTVVEGSTALDASLVTGESLPAEVSPGDAVTGATVNTWGTVLVRATRVGQETTLAQIGRMVTEAQAGKAPVQRIADQVSAVFVPVVLVISALTLLGWLALGAAVQTAVTTAVAVLVVACPCALGLATPTALLVGSGRAARLGIVIKSAEVLEQTRRIDTMVLDKTGTVTTGRMSLEAVVTAPGIDEGGEVLNIAAGLEAPSEHPVARALVAGAIKRGARPAGVDSFTNHPGLGVSALVANTGGGAGNTGKDLYLLGRQSWLRDFGVEIPAPLAEATALAHEGGATAVLLARVANWSDTVSTSAPTSGPDATLVDPRGPAPAVLAAPVVAVIEMDVQGMTCASCVRRVERKLGKVDGVSASVNLATESATITVTRELSDAELEAVVEAAGYKGAVRARRPAPVAGFVEASGPADVATERVLPARLTDAQAIAALIVRDQVKDTSARAIAELKDLGITPVLLTGDNRGAAEHVGAAVGIDRVLSEVMPEDKQQVIAALQAEGATTAMVGDGVNDAAALAQAGRAGLGMAMGGGTDVAKEVADIVLVNSELTSATSAIRISRRTLRTIRQNLFWAFVYNVAMIPLAVLGMLNPMIASAAMAMSSVFVVLNSLRLRTAK